MIFNCTICSQISQTKCENVLINRGVEGERQTASQRVIPLCISLFQGKLAPVKLDKSLQGFVSHLGDVSEASKKAAKR